jgi:2'-5' RNA ligase
MIRSFLALDLSENAREAIRRVVEDFRKADAWVSWTRVEQIHLTLKFLGNIPDEMVPGVAETLAETCSPVAPFRLQPEGCGAFPSLEQMRIIWVGLREEGASLLRLQKEVEAAMVPLGFPVEQRPFRPHLTVGRVKGRRGLHALREKLSKHADFHSEPFNVTEIVLYRSDLRPDGARYSPLFRAPLSGAPGS